MVVERSAGSLGSYASVYAVVGQRYGSVFCNNIESTGTARCSLTVP